VLLHKVIQEMQMREKVKGFITVLRQSKFNTPCQVGSLSSGQLLSVTDASATYSVQCSLFCAMLLNIIPCLPDV